jgi:hypothetical protein
MRSEYFTRLWVVQEVVLARSIRVLVHDVWFSWEDVEKAREDEIYATMVGNRKKKFPVIKDYLL